jgi:gliding motility-associated-like protein
MDGPNGIHAYNPALPLSPTNPTPIGIPNGGGGLTLMPNINGGTLSPTFYSVIGGNYSFWNGSSWQGTGHGTGSGAAVNLGGCNGAIYNLVGATGQVYVYNGTGTGSLLTTINGFNGGGPYDLVTDCNCNFYVLKTTTPNQNLTLYNQAGTVLCSYSLSNLPNASAGGGFAIIGNTVYLKNNLTNGFFVGNISGSSITFTNLIGFSLSPGDFASCPVCIPSATLQSANIGGGILGCTLPTVNVIVTTTASPVNYSWSGPGIVGPTTNSSAVVNSTGIYTCVISANGCPASQLTLTTTIISSVIPVYASITPSGNICINAGTSIPLNLTSTSTLSTVQWSGPGVNGNGSSLVFGSQPGVYSATVTDMFTGCAGASSVVIAHNPVVSLSLSSPTLCSQAIQGSPASITLTPSGANVYTLFTQATYSTTSPNGPTMPIVPLPPFSNTLTVANATLLGFSSFCSDTSIVSFSILPNPVISAFPLAPDICFGNSVALTVSGANTYTWSSSPGLSNYLGAFTVASPTQSTQYTVTGSSNGCFGQPLTVSVNVLPLPVFSITPSNSLICLGAQASFSATGNAASYSWTPSTGLSATSGANVFASPPATQVYQVVGTLNTCTSLASASLMIMNPPTLSLSLNQNTLCAFNFNGSTNTIQATPLGAASYTMINGPNYSVSNANGPLMQIAPAGPPPTVPSVITLTLNGSSSVCNVSSTYTVMVLPNPTITATPGFTAICPGKSQILTAQGANQYTWTPISNLSAYTGSMVISISPSVSSLYSVVGSSMGCRSLTKNASVNILPLPNVEIIPNTSTVCVGNSVTLTVIGNGQQYDWSPPLFLSSATGSQVICSPTANQTYTVTGSLNTCTRNAVATVSAIAVPVVSASASNSVICSGATTILHAEGAISYSWIPNYYLNVNQGQNVFASPVSSTTYTLRGFNGVCTGTTDIYIETVARPIMTLTAPYNQVCIGYSVPIVLEGAQFYSWSPVYGLSAITGSMSYASPQVTTNYTITGVNANGMVECSQVVSFSVIVSPNVIASASESVALCEGEKATLKAFGGNTFKWQPAEGLNTTQLNAVVAGPTISTIYTVEVSDNTFCGSTATVFVQVNPKPFVFASRDTSYNLDEPMYISASGTGTLSWISGENIECPLCPTTRVFPGNDECYVVKTVNAYGCTAQDVVCIDVTNDFGIYIPNAFTPNQDGLNDVFYVVGTGLSNFKMEIYNRWGQRVFLSESQTLGWDGYFKNQPSQSDEYTFKVDYTGLNGKRYQRTGSVLLNR